MPETNGVMYGAPPDDPARLEAIINRFEDAWERGEHPSVADHLPADDRQRFTLLVELVHVDLENRLKAGDVARVEDYLRRYPELSHNRAVVRELVDAEWAIRRRQESTVSATEYAERFPHLRDELLASDTRSFA